MRANGKFTDIVDHTTSVLQYPAMDRNLSKDNSGLYRKRSWTKTEYIPGIGFCVVTHLYERYEIQKVGCELIGFGRTLESAIENMVEAGVTANDIFGKRGPKRRELR